MITNREFSEKSGHDYQKVRRWSRDLFGIDHQAGQASGRAREYTVDEAFLLYLGSVLISRRKVSIPDSKTILNLLSPWLYDHKLLPISTKHELVKFNADNRDLIISDWSIIALFYDSGDLCLSVEASCHEPWVTDGAPGQIGEISWQMGEISGMKLYKEYNFYGSIKEDCEGSLVNSVNIGFDALASEFKYKFGVK